jgi:hypothetical protein
VPASINEFFGLMFVSLDISVEFLCAVALWLISLAREQIKAYN